MTFTIAIFSDLHISSSAPDEQSYTGTKRGRRRYDPVVDVRQASEDYDLSVDVVLCAGDIADRGDPGALRVGWAALQEIGQFLGANHVIATPGNHDLQSRLVSGDIAGAAKGLLPSYPTGDAVRDADFWKRGLAVVEGKSWRIISLNSCVEHTNAPPPTSSHGELEGHRKIVERGSFPTTIEDALLSEVSRITKPVNILMCHHHPVEHEHENLFEDEYGAMISGRRLLSTLRQDLDNQWLLVHGHRHIPRIQQDAVGGTSGPLLIGAASTSAKLWDPVVTVTRNQFHILTFPSLAGSAGPLRGTVESFMWGFGLGWRPAPPIGTGLPGHCGFGGILQGERLAATIAGQLSPEEPILAAPSLPLDAMHLLPADLERLEKQLLNRGVAIYRDGARIGQVVLRSAEV